MRHIRESGTGNDIDEGYCLWFLENPGGFAIGRFKDSPYAGGSQMGKAEIAR